MQYEEQQGALVRKRRNLTSVLAWSFNDDDFVMNYAIVNELRRLGEQSELQHLARMKVLSSTFNPNSISDLQCLQRCRFTRKDVRFLADLIPWGKRLDHEGRMRTSQKLYPVDPVEATAIMLRQLATASRWVDVEPEFGEHRSALSEIFYHALELFYSEFGSSLETWPESLVTLRAREYEKSVEKKGYPLDSVVAFIDSIGIEIARPRGISQRATHSGHKRNNCLKFQAISAPDRLVLHLFGPVEGRRHEMFLYKESGIDDNLRSSLVISNR
jgi:hypothetical protein